MASPPSADAVERISALARGIAVSLRLPSFLGACPAHCFGRSLRVIDIESLLRASTVDKAYIKKYERENAANVLRKLRHFASSLTLALAVERANSERLQATLDEALRANENARAHVEAWSRLHEQETAVHGLPPNAKDLQFSPNIRVKGAELSSMWESLETLLHETTFSAVGKLIAKLRDVHVDRSIDTVDAFPLDKGALCKLVLTMSNGSVVEVHCKANDTFIVDGDEPVQDARAAAVKITSRIPAPCSLPPFVLHLLFFIKFLVFSGLEEYYDLCPSAGRRSQPVRPCWRNRPCVLPSRLHSA